MTSRRNFDTSVAGDTRTFTFIGTNDAGEPESIAGDTLTFRAYDDEANEILLTVGNGITIHPTQSGATLGHATVQVNYADYPSAWLEKPATETTFVRVEFKRITAAGKRRTPEQTGWELKGQGIQ